MWYWRRRILKYCSRRRKEIVMEANMDENDILTRNETGEQSHNIFSIINHLKIFHNTNRYL
jgi:hypothetical protein